VTTVERGLQAAPGVHKAHVNFTQGKAQVTYHPEQIDMSHLVGTVKKAGYHVGAVCPVC
jgi:copper chaperone CopZ